MRRRRNRSPRFGSLFARAFLLLLGCVSYCSRRSPATNSQGFQIFILLGHLTGRVVIVCARRGELPKLDSFCTPVIKKLARFSKIAA